MMTPIVHMINLGADPHTWRGEAGGEVGEEEKKEETNREQGEREQSKEGQSEWERKRTV
jgi:hypothetical protein